MKSLFPTRNSQKAFYGLTFLFFVLIFLVFYTRSTTTELYTKKWSEVDRSYLISNLDSTLNLIIREINTMNEAQWNWSPDSGQWSSAWVVEHLIVHDELFYREVRVLTGLPSLPPQGSSDFSSDEIILSYKEINSENAGQAPPYLEPHGRWSTKQDAIKAYNRSRNALMQFVKATDKDLRKFYTASGRGPTKYRDLHQLLLISVAHTLRHHSQILKLKTLWAAADGSGK